MDSLLSLLLLWSTLSVLAAQWGTRAPAALCFCAVLSGGELSELTRLRHTAAEELHTLRYGEAPLSQGSLADAGRLNESDAAVLEVRTEQEKTLYLRAYVGAELSRKVWFTAAGEPDGGDYAGMLDWLAEQGFDPLTQSALYYALSERKRRSRSSFRWMSPGAHGAISMRPSRRNALTGRTMASGRTSG